MNETTGRLLGRAAKGRLLFASICVLLCATSCERTPRKSDYVGARVQIECEGQTGEAFTLCRIEVIKRYMDVPFEEMQKRFPPPEPKGDRLGCGGA